MSSMTPHQINKAVANYRAMLEKHAPNFPVDAVQEVLGDSAFAAAQLNLLRKSVEARTKTIAREFTVDPNLGGMLAIDATGRTKHSVNGDVVAVMPRAIAPNGVIHFFQAGRPVPVGEVDAEYTKRGLVAVDPHSLAAFNTANPTFADTHPNGTQWQDAKGRCCCVVFGWWHDWRNVHVDWRNRDWGDDWWFAGVKPSELTT